MVQDPVLPEELRDSNPILSGGANFALLHPLLSTHTYQASLLRKKVVGAGLRLRKRFFKGEDGAYFLSSQHILHFSSGGLFTLLVK